MIPQICFESHWKPNYKCAIKTIRRLLKAYFSKMRTLAKDIYKILIICWLFVNNWWILTYPRNDFLLFNNTKLLCVPVKRTFYMAPTKTDKLSCHIECRDRIYCHAMWRCLELYWEYHIIKRLTFYLRDFSEVKNILNCFTLIELFGTFGITDTILFISKHQNIK